MKRFLKVLVLSVIVTGSSAAFADDGCSARDEKMVADEGYISDPLLTVRANADDQLASQLAKFYRQEIKAYAHTIKTDLENLEKISSAKDIDTACYKLSRVEQKFVLLSDNITNLVQLNHPGKRCFSFNKEDSRLSTEMDFYNNALAQVCNDREGRMWAYKIQRDSLRSLSEVVKNSHAAVDRIDKNVDSYLVRGNL